MENFRSLILDTKTSDEVKKILHPQLVNPRHLKAILKIYHVFGNKYFSEISYSEENSSAYNPNEVHHSLIIDNGYYINENKYDKINDEKKTEKSADEEPDEKKHDASDDEDPQVGGDNLVHWNNDNKDSIVWFNTAKNTSTYSKTKIDELATFFEDLIGDKTLISSSRIASILEDYLFVKNFPHLFPGGRGGYNEYRPNKISFKAYIGNRLRLSTRRFQGPDFTLYAYDVENRLRFFKENYIRSKQKPGGNKSVDEMLGALSKEEILRCCKYYQECRRNLRKKIKLPDIPDTLSENAIFFQQNIEIMY